MLQVVLPLSLLISLEYQQHGVEYRPTAMRLKIMVISQETIWSRASSVLLTPPQSTMESQKIVVNRPFPELARPLLTMPFQISSNVSGKSNVCFSSAYIVRPKKLQFSFPYFTLLAPCPRVCSDISVIPSPRS